MLKPEHAADSDTTQELRISPTLAEDVCAALNTDRDSGNILRRNAVVNFSNTPPLLRLAGLPGLNIVSTVNRVRKMQRGHHLTAEQIVSLPSGYAVPVVVFGVKEGYFIITRQTTANAEGIASPIAVFLRQEQPDNILLASAYPMDEAIKRHYAEAVKGRMLLHFDNKQAAKLEDEIQFSIKTSNQRLVTLEH